MAKKENWAEYWKIEALSFEKKYNDLLKEHNELKEKISRIEGKDVVQYADIDGSIKTIKKGE